MKKKRKIIYIGALTILSLFLIGFVFVRGFIYAPTDEITVSQYENSIVPAPEPEQKDNSKKNYYPEEIRIPKIDVNTKVQYVGITKKGNMSAPNNYEDVGWYKYGTLPGEKGSAIFAGHVDNGFSLPAVFFNLKKLDKGDDIYVKNKNGETLHFKVTNYEIYDFRAPTQEIFNQNDDSYIKLITCSGIWSKEYKTREKRLIVTAVKVS